VGCFVFACPIAIVYTRAYLRAHLAESEIPTLHLEAPRCIPDAACPRARTLAIREHRAMALLERDWCKLVIER
jgi:hypothetical protein